MANNIVHLQKKLHVQSFYLQICDIPEQKLI